MLAAQPKLGSHAMSWGQMTLGANPLPPPPVLQVAGAAAHERGLLRLRRGTGCARRGAAIARHGRVRGVRGLAWRSRCRPLGWPRARPTPP